MKTTVVNIRHSSCDVYIGRGRGGSTTLWGNPFPLERGMARGSTLPRFRALMEERLQQNPEFWSKELKTLRGKRLGCFCKPHPCHGDVILEYIERYIPD